MMNKKGFNLFTALVAAILILLTTLLISAMIQSESSVRGIIQEKDQQARLESVAEIMQNDSVNLFNYYMRQRIEAWIVGEPDNFFSVDNPEDCGNEEECFEAIKNDFAESNFGVNIVNPTGPPQNASFVSYLSFRVCGIMQSVSAGSRTYNIAVENCTSDVMKEVLEKAIEKAVDNENFFQVIECNGKIEGCEKGTFYVNLPFKEIDQATYEKLPTIKITDTTTGRSIRKIILPRRNIKLYVPIRIFRAITIGREISHLNGGSVFSPQNKSSFEKYRLGMCDAGSCSPRHDVVAKESAIEWKSQPECDNGQADACSCPGATSYSSLLNKTKIDDVKLNGIPTGVDYSPYGDAQEHENALYKVLGKKICEISNDVVEGLNLDTEEMEVLTNAGCVASNISGDYTAFKNAKITVPDYSGEAGCYLLSEGEFRVTIREKNDNYKVNPDLYTSETAGINLRFSEKIEQTIPTSSWNCETKTASNDDIGPYCLLTT